MFKLICPVLALLLFISCSKKSDTIIGGPYPNPVIMPDTLSAGWTKVSTGSTATFNDIFFVDNSYGFACGASGIYRSSDGGVNWSHLISTASPVNIAAANSSRACFIDNSEKIYLTTNGTTIQEAAVHFTPDSIPTFKDAFFSSNTVCYASSSKYIWKSLDGGLSFDSIYNFHEPSDANNLLYFVNDLTGWINRQGKIFKTTDGGHNWTLQFSGSPGIAINFINSGIGFISANYLIYKTIDGGDHFTPINNITYYSADICFVNSTTGFVSSDNHIYKTTDGGNTWAQIIAVGSPQTFVEIHFTDANHGWACGTNGLLLRFNQ